jgi:ketosteroid isomerase-like protein
MTASSVGRSGRHDRAEVEAAYQEYKSRSDAGDWAGFCDLFTEDAVCVEHVFGVFSGREEIRAWMLPTMAPLVDAGWEFPHQWHMIDGDRVVFKWLNRLPNLDGRDRAYEFAGISVIEYAGGGLWCFEEDFYNFKEVEEVLREYVAAGGSASAAG